MTKITARICTGNYNHVEVEENIDSDIPKEKIEEIVTKYREIQNKFVSETTSQKSPEVILDGKKCPKCNNLVVESLGISPKNQKAYHYIKCINNKDKNSSCDYLEWVSVSKIPESVEIEQK